MKKVILRYRLEKFHHALAFQILYQTPSFCNTGDGTCSFAIPNMPRAVESCSNPELSDSSIYLRGEELNRNLKISVRTFATNKERDTYFDETVFSLELWANNFDRWGRNSRLNPNGLPECEEETLRGMLRVPFRRSKSRCIELCIP